MMLTSLHPLLIVFLEEVQTEKEHLAMECRQILYLADADPTLDAGLCDALEQIFNNEGMVRNF
jgi:hypothetical protein